MSNSGFLRSAGALLVLTVSTAGVYAAQIPLCANEGNPNPNPIRKAVSIPLERPEIGLIYRPSKLPEIVVEAEIGNDGKLACYSPLSGWSIYWSSAVPVVPRELLKEEFHNGPSKVLVFDGPGALPGSKGPWFRKSG